MEASLTRGSEALRLLAHGSPLSRTLEAAANVAASIRGSAGCGILLIDGDAFVLGASCGLQAGAQRLLSRCSHLSINDCLRLLGESQRTEVRSLVTASAELIGAVVVFDMPTTGDLGLIAAQMDEVCAIAMLAIESKHLVDELYFRAHHDALTQTWNRLWMEGEVARVLDDSVETGFGTGLMVIGIDSFRVINELLGSQVGNDLLREITGRLDNALQVNWSLARCSGDEFVILMPDLRSADQVYAYAEEIIGVFAQPFELGDHELIVRASIGTAYSAAGECRADEMQNRAEIALRHGKRCLRGRVSPFTKAMASTPPERLEMERHLRFALQKREFEIFYQPQVQLSTGKLIGVEALLRWRHPSLGFISPASFIPIAEQIGIIDEIGAWVLTEAIHQLSYWHHTGLTDLRVAVNVSAIQFSRDDFASLVSKSLRKSDIRPHDLELEITESAVMTNFESGARQMRLLQSLGVMTALDDFGTGHSSLAYLKQLPIQRIKIDRMFVKDIASEHESHPLLSGIIQMGRALGCAVIAEGIETAEQALALTALQCDEVQGYFFSKPLPPNELLTWAKSR